MITLRPANERGHHNHGWLDANHSFSFGEYYDPAHMGFRSLRVINEDRVQPGQGFPTHPHRDMEIITYVLEGALEHKDSMGNGSVIRPGDIQYMSAGSGVTHSEFNHSKSELVHLLQIWIMPSELKAKPRYDQKTFVKEDKLGKLRLLASSDGREGSVAIRQDAKLFACVLTSEQKLSYELASGRHAWLQVARGEIKLNDQTLRQGDGAAISQESTLHVVGTAKESEFLLFDLD